MSVPHAVVRASVEPHPADAAATFAVSENHSNDDNDPCPTGRLVELPTGPARNLPRVPMTLIIKLRYWLAWRICRRYAREYLPVVDRMGLEWTLVLIDEDVELYGNPFVHALARAGVIEYAERAADLAPRTPSTGPFRARSVLIRPCQPCVAFSCVNTHISYYNPPGVAIRRRPVNDESPFYLCVVLSTGQKQNICTVLLRLCSGRAFHTQKSDIRLANDVSLFWVVNQYPSAKIPVSIRPLRSEHEFGYGAIRPSAGESSGPHVGGEVGDERCA